MRHWGKCGLKLARNRDGNIMLEFAIGSAVLISAMAGTFQFGWDFLQYNNLENAVARALAHTSTPLIHVGDLPSSLHHPPAEELAVKDEILPLEELERRAILRTLRETNGDKVAASRMLGIGKTTLYRKLKQYKVELPEA